MVSKLDNSVRIELLRHLSNLQNPQEAAAFCIGERKQLETVAKISSEEITEYLTYAGHMGSFPYLSGRKCLVACVNRFLDVQIYAIYSRSQMVGMEEQRGSGQVKSIEWAVLEVEEAVVKELSKGIQIGDGFIVGSAAAFHGESSGSGFLKAVRDYFWRN